MNRLVPAPLPPVIGSPAAQKDRFKLIFKETDTFLLNISPYLLNIYF
jgi:hypothetical protein